jgi:hypothetical protein
VSNLLRVLALSALCVLPLACAKHEAPAQRSPQQAGKPLDPVATAARIATIRGQAALGDQDGVRRNMEALNDDVRRSMKLADPGRPIDHEQARAAIRGVDGVRSVAWVDRTNLLVIVDLNEHRSQRTIDDICMALEPLGDTLSVVVNLQSGAATNGDELEILSRNCQLAPGDRALLQRDRKIDVIDPRIREQHKAAQAATAQRDRQKEQEESMRILEQTTPEM